MESSKTISTILEYAPMIDSFRMDCSIIVFSPTVTFGPMIEFFMSQLSPIRNYQ